MGGWDLETGADPRYLRAVTQPSESPSESARNLKLALALRRSRRRFRRGSASPSRGWRLLESGLIRLKLWEPLHDCYAQRAFALACHTCVPQLEPLARTEAVLGDSLVVRVASSAVASHLKFAEEPLLLAVNEALRAADASGTWAKRKRPLRRLQFRVATRSHVGELPDHAAWTAPPAPPTPQRQRPASAVDVEVVAATSQLEDPTLRSLLQALYVTACNAGRSK